MAIEEKGLTESRVTKYDIETDAIMKRVNAAKIVTQEDYDREEHYFKTIRLLKKTIKDDFKDTIASAHALHKQLKAQEKDHLELPEKAEGILKEKLNNYIREQTKIREDAERKNRAEEERLRKIEENRILEESIDALKNGASVGEVDEILNQEVITEPVKVDVLEMPNFDKRVLGKTKWTYRVKDESLIPREYLMINEVQIRGLVRAMKDKTDIPGIEVFETQS